MEQGLLTDLYYDEILKIINEIRASTPLLSTRP